MVQEFLPSHSQNVATGGCQLYLQQIEQWVREGTMANVGDRIRALREEKKLSQGDIEKRTGLLRCYISRVENCHTVPSIETLEKLARALELPLYRLFYDGEVPPKLPTSLRRNPEAKLVWGTSGKNALYLSKLRRCLARIDERDRKLLMATAQKVAVYGKGRDRGAVTADVEA